MLNSYLPIAVEHYISREKATLIEALLNDPRNLLASSEKHRFVFLLCDTL